MQFTDIYIKDKGINKPISGILSENHSLGRFGVPYSSDFYLDKRSFIGGGETSKSTKFSFGDSVSIDGFEVFHGKTSSHKCDIISLDSPLSFPLERKTTLSSCLCKLLKSYTLDSSSILVAGIGNRFIVSDSLGTLTCKKLGIGVSSGKLFAVSPGTPSQTGIDTARLVSTCAELTKADVIITVDSLCTSEISRLGVSIQISDVGLIPGSALSHTSSEISSDTMPCKVVSVGVPTVFYFGGKLLTAASIDLTVDFFSGILAGAITKLVFPGNTAS